jgi:hypothetical protein
MRLMDALVESSPPISKDARAQVKSARIFFFLSVGVLLVGALAFPFAWASRYAMNPDGMSYLDIARQVVDRGNWHAFLNAHWSPAYPALVAATLGIFRPNSVNEFSAVHLLNWLVFLWGAVTFGWFAWELQSSVPERSAEYVPSPILFYAFSYLIFFWGIQEFVPLSLVTPDLLLAVILFGVAAMSTRILRKKSSPWAHAVLGVLLGIAYLTKAPLMPLGILLLVILLVSNRHHWKRVGLALASFLLIAAPFIAGLSRKEGHFTTGESGTLNYLWWVDGVAPLVGWPEHEWHPTWSAGPIEAYGHPEHAPAIVARHPLMTAFAYPTDVTYPPWFDPAYWYRGIRPKLNLRHHASVIWENMLKITNAQAADPASYDKRGRGDGAPGTQSVVRELSQSAQAAEAAPYDRGGREDRAPGTQSVVRELFRSLLAVRGYLMLGLVVLAFALGGRAAWRNNWWAVVWCGAGVILFLLIHFEWRYVAGFILVGLLAVFSELLHRDRSIGTAVLLTVSAVLPFQIAVSVLPFARAAADRGPSAAAPLERCLENVEHSGLRPGDRVALVGTGARAYFAHIAQLRIVSEIRDPDQLSPLSEQTRAQLSHELRSTGARALILSSDTCKIEMLPNRRLAVLAPSNR